MEGSQRKVDEVAVPSVRFHDPAEPLSGAAQEALDRRSLEEHQAAIDRALRRR